jgi:hypothetical protein
MAEQKSIESKVLLIVQEKSNEERGTKMIIRVVDWIVDNKNYPMLEKRQFFKGADGILKTGKAKGFNLSDLLLIQENWDEIVAALG